MRKNVCPECQDEVSNNEAICESCDRALAQVKCAKCGYWCNFENSEICPQCETPLKRIFVILDCGEEIENEDLIDGKYRVLSSKSYGLVVSDEKPNLSSHFREPKNDLELAYQEMGYLKDIVKIRRDEYIVVDSPFRTNEEKFPTLPELWKSLGNFEKIKYLKLFIRRMDTLFEKKVTRSILDGEVFVRNGDLFVFPLSSDEEITQTQDVIERIKLFLLETIGDSDFIVQRVFAELQQIEYGIEEILESLDRVKENLETRFVLESFGSTDLGPVRENNEDDFFAVEFSFSQPDSLCIGGRGLKQRGLYLLCDGMGGHQKGEVASALIIRELRKRLMPLLLEEVPPGDFEEEIKEIIKDSNDVLLEVNILEGIPAHEGRMGTTLVAVVAYENEIFIVHVGDSRCYMYSEGELSLLTEDHNLATQALHAGTFKTRKEAEQMRGGKVLTQALGPREGTHLLPDARRAVVRGECYLILCSDGLTDVVTDDGMKAIIDNTGDNLRRIVNRLIQQAYRNGTRDNITILVIRFKRRE